MFNNIFITGVITQQTDKAIMIKVPLDETSHPYPFKPSISFWCPKSQWKKVDETHHFIASWVLKSNGDKAFLWLCNKIKTEYNIDTSKWLIKFAKEVDAPQKKVVSGYDDNIEPVFGWEVQNKFREMCKRVLNKQKGVWSKSKGLK